MSQPDRKLVFIVSRSDSEIATALGEFLASIGLKHLRWDDAVHLTNLTAPTALQVVQTALQHAQATVVVFAGDDLARPGLRFGSQPLEPQSRPNVLIEAGMAFALQPKRVIIVKVGPHRQISDLAGIVRVDLDSQREGTSDLLTRLRTAGCDVIATSVPKEWDSRFKSLVGDPDGGWLTRRTEVRLARGVGAIALLALCCLTLVMAYIWPGKTVHISGNVTSSRPGLVHAVGVPDHENSIVTKGDYSLSLPMLPRLKWRIYYVVGDTIVDRKDVPLQGNSTILTHDFHYQESNRENTSDPGQGKIVGNDEVQAFLEKQ